MPPQSLAGTLFALDATRPAVILAGIVFLSILTFVAKFRSLNLPLPPGPPRSSLVHVEMPSLAKSEELTRLYGPVFSLRSIFTTVIVVGRRQAAIDLGEKEGLYLADRPISIAAGEILSAGMRILLMSSGKRFKLLRRALHSHLQPRVVSAYEPTQTRFARILVIGLLDDPIRHQALAKEFAVSTILSTTYGKQEPVSWSDPDVQAIMLAAKRLGIAASQDSFVVNELPFLKYIPYFTRELRSWHHDELDLFSSHLNAVRQNMVKGIAPPSFVRYLVERQGEHGLNDDEMAYIAGSMYGAGSETTAAAISVLVMAAAKFPKEQALVQEEMDSVLTDSSPPTFSDRERLPRLTAFIYETYRWRPVAGRGFPHRARRDLFWGNYRIPKGSTVIFNQWSLNQDPAFFPDPEQFRLSRFLREDGTLNDNTSYIQFGFGRRIRPGQHLAHNSIYINAALILWAFKISEDPASPIDPDAFAESAVGASPKPFSAIFKPRQERIGEILASD